MQSVLHWFNLDLFTDQAVSFWNGLASPQWLSFIAVSFFALIVGLLIHWQRKRLAPKKAALRLLSMPLGYQTPSSAIELLRQTAFCYFPREQIAHLKGDDWYAFLDEQLEQSVFMPKAQTWQQTLRDRQPIEHPEQLVADCSYWIEHALPPSRKQRNKTPKITKASTSH